MSRRPAARGSMLAAAVLLALAAGPARAQAEDPTTPDVPPPAAPVPPPADPADPPAPPPEDLAEVFEDKNRVPQNPALDVLDANGLNAVKPGSVKDLATDLRALYAGGKIVPQIAVEVSPYALVYGRRTTHHDYRDRWYVPLLHRLSISVATTSIGDAPDQATVGAVGLRVRLFDRSDWRLDEAAVSCALDAAKLAAPPAQPGGGVVVVVPADDAAEARKVKECFDKARKRVGTWNAPQLAVGAALSSAFPGGKLQADIRDLTAWIGWGHKLGPGGLLIVTGKYLFGDVRRDGEVRIPARHTALLAAEVERRGDRFGVLGSLGAGARWSDDAGTMTWSGAWIGQLGAGVQLRVSDASWWELRTFIQLVEDGDGAFVSLANFKWNFDVKPSKARSP